MISRLFFLTHFTKFFFIFFLLAEHHLAILSLPAMYKVFIFGGILLF